MSELPSSRSPPQTLAQAKVALLAWGDETEIRANTFRTRTAAKAGDAAKTAAGGITALMLVLGAGRLLFGSRKTASVPSRATGSRIERSGSSVRNALHNVAGIGRWIGWAFVAHLGQEVLARTTQKYGTPPHKRQP
jgi:hypothetical protein